MNNTDTGYQKPQMEVVELVPESSILEMSGIMFYDDQYVDLDEEGL